jgi:hypothetical protein
MSKTKELAAGNARELGFARRAPRPHRQDDGRRGYCARDTAP